MFFFTLLSSSFFLVLFSILCVYNYFNLNHYHYYHSFWSSRFWHIYPFINLWWLSWCIIMIIIIIIIFINFHDNLYSLCIDINMIIMMTNYYHFLVYYNLHFYTSFTLVFLVIITNIIIIIIMNWFLLWSSIIIVGLSLPLLFLHRYHLLRHCHYHSSNHYLLLIEG